MKLTQTIKDGERTEINTLDIDPAELILAKEAKKLLEERKVHEFGINFNAMNRDKNKEEKEEPSAQELLDEVEDD